MADAGRIKHHIANKIGDARNTILFSGYCSPHGLGGKLIAGDKTVRIFTDDYEVKEGEMLSKLIERAGGISPSAYLPRAYLFRGANALESEAIKINIADLQKGADIELVNGDNVKILSQKDFQQQYQIDVIGYVRKPGKVTYYKNLKLKDALLLSGGLRLDAENGRIEISNIVDCSSCCIVFKTVSAVLALSLSFSLYFYIR